MSSLGKLKFIIVLLIICLVVWGIYAYINRSIYVHQVINPERYRSCTVDRCIGELEKVEIKDKEAMGRLFSFFMNRRIRKSMPWEKDFRTYYRITTDENNIVIYNNEYLAVERDDLEVFYKFINPIEPEYFERYFLQ